MKTSNDILFEVRGCAGIVTLNKPKTLNAVTDAMLTALNGQLDVWEEDDAVRRIIIKAVPGRAFSAGGDIRHLYDRGTAGDYDYDFFAREYRLNARIANLSKPYIALVDGIAMGGGVGVSFHGSHRVAGGGITFAMPEVGIGFFPDVGASYFLSRLPGQLGLYLGLTGDRVKQGDALWCGLATSACASDQMGALEAALCNEEDIKAQFEKFSISLEPGILQQEQSRIDRFFAGDGLKEITARLTTAAEDKDGEDAVWAGKTLAKLNGKSPTSLAIATRQINMGRNLDINDCMRMEYRILKRILSGAEFYEGIRAAIIDKDNLPKWSPTALAEIDPGVIDAHFTDLGDEELQLP